MTRRIILFGMFCLLMAGSTGCGVCRSVLYSPFGPGTLCNPRHCCDMACGAPCGDACGPQCGSGCGPDCGPTCGPCATPACGSGCGPTCGPRGGPPCGSILGAIFGPAVAARRMMGCGGACRAACGPICEPACEPACGPSCEPACGPPCGSCADPCGDPCSYRGHCGFSSWFARLFLPYSWCGGSCGEIYWGDFHGDPPDCCDPCDRCGNFTGCVDGCTTECGSGGGCGAGGCIDAGCSGCGGGEYYGGGFPAAKRSSKIAARPVRMTSAPRLVQPRNTARR